MTSGAAQKAANAVNKIAWKYIRSGFKTAGGDTELGIRSGAIDCRSGSGAVGAVRFQAKTALELAKGSVNDTESERPSSPWLCSKKWYGTC